MTIQTINIGNQVNDGLGDDLRTAFEKVNANFNAMDGQLTVTASNAGSVGAGIFKQKTDQDLEFKRLVSGNKILVDEAADSVIINNTAPDAFTRIDTNSGSMLASTFQQITLQGGNDVDVTVLGSVITVNNVIPVTKILQTYDFGPIIGSYETTTQLALAAANIDFGTIGVPGRIDIDCGGII